MRLMRLNFALFAALLASQTAISVPPFIKLSESGNERDVEWKRLENRRFSIYHDAKANELATHAFGSLEEAYPYLSYLLGVQIGSDESLPRSPEKNIKSRFDRIPVIISTRSDWGGFADFATQNLELQASSGARASLFQHELVHRMMYEHFDPYFGPAGRAATLLVLPTWWIEGLAEHLSESIGRSQTLAMARSIALNKKFLSFDRMHALYQSGQYMTRGYVLSNRLVGYILSQSQQKNLFELNKSFFHKILTPPFFNAPNRFLKEHLGKDADTVYAEFKTHEVQHWRSYLEGMPSLGDAVTLDEGFESSGVPNSVITQKSVIVSNLEKGPVESSLLVMDTASGKKLRRPVPFEGSVVFDVLPTQTHDGQFWTVLRKKYSNKAHGYLIRMVEFAGEIDSESVRWNEPVDLELGNKDFPVSVGDIYALPSKKLFVTGVVRGQWSLFLVDGNTQTHTLVRSFAVPSQPKIIRRQNRKDECVSILVEGDLERTSIERVCANGNIEMRFPEKRLNILDALERDDGSYVVTASWHDALGLFRLDGEKLSTLSATSDWFAGLTPAPNENVGAWIFDGEEYHFRLVDLNKAKTAGESWHSKLATNSRWRQPAAFSEYLPPFKRLALGDGFVHNETSKSFSQGTSETRTEEVRKTVRDEEASYRSSHFFTYPTYMPPPFSSGILGIVSTPLQDEMERYKLFVIGTYDFGTKALSGSATYVNNRVLDSFAATGFTRELFNGPYYITPCPTDGSKRCLTSRYTKNPLSHGINYLRENGAQIEASKDFIQTSGGVTARVGSRRLMPLYDSMFSSPHPGVGPQRANLVDVGAGVSGELFKSAFYMASKSNTEGKTLYWTGGWGADANYHRSFGKVSDGRGNALHALEFQDYSLALSTRASYRDHALTLRSSASTTQGKYALNLRQYYQPYRTYLPGSGGGINATNFGFGGDDRLFRISNGYWSFRNSVDYGFPLWDNIDTYFYSLYFEDIRGEVVLARGGIAREKDFSGIAAVTSASVAARANINIKGVKVFPSVAYGRLIGEPGWSLFCELAFTELL